MTDAVVLLDRRLTPEQLAGPWLVLYPRPAVETPMRIQGFYADSSFRRELRTLPQPRQVTWASGLAVVALAIGSLLSLAGTLLVLWLGTQAFVWLVRWLTGAGGR